MATPRTQPILDPSLISTSEISVVQGPHPSTTLSSDITVVPAPQPPKKGSNPRGKKAAMNKSNNTATNSLSQTYLEHEDIQLYNSWLKISEDPKRGTNQMFNAFWEAIARHYATHIPDAPQSAKSLKNHWSDKI
ncbi:uncharacterized protein PGTG_21631 [Puccinia graminis f. sp. tritici CRL 75-36-700-3]|uniref:No apical meristem-associated C-terminal domain-containing protein n=1 Tax=Puccinia graminis f. sp. tritici (strain CRL 75-36-700-3 / race SCCL) TaxID=418459 RepID=H6QRN4_PUCGT|nr:uncharacterized protein PGTG_21631 [Puccinia graminis f. sp. tritici CRL 75-36-700-3]EHS63328.1 hypothetical protein PGTG_21631 [Puccinia graminis f. sp. tritici CRL 75-36-700-3]